MKRTFSILAVVFTLLIIGGCQESKTEKMLSNICMCFAEFETVDQLENASANQITNMRTCVKDAQAKNKELLKDLPQDEVSNIQKQLEKDMKNSDCYVFLKEL
jgi:outer membrane murein-binding lipoprotein Lpp